MGEEAPLSRCVALQRRLDVHQVFETLNDNLWLKIKENRSLGKDLVV